MVDPNRQRASLLLILAGVAMLVASALMHSSTIVHIGLASGGAVVFAAGIAMRLRQGSDDS